MRKGCGGVGQHFSDHNSCRIRKILLPELSLQPDFFIVKSAESEKIDPAGAVHGHVQFSPARPPCNHQGFISSFHSPLFICRISSQNREPKVHIVS